MEIWKSIVGFDGLYEVSNLGNVRSVGHIVKSKGGTRMTNGKLLSPTLGNGYYRVCLKHPNGKKYSKLVHRLVAEAFIPNLDNLPYVNHKDEDKTNNKVENLEYCDALYNTNYGDGKKKSIKSRILSGNVNPDYVGLDNKTRQKLWYQANRETILKKQKEYKLKKKSLNICSGSIATLENTL